MRKTLLAIVALLCACTNYEVCFTANRCPNEIPAAIRDDPRALHDLIVDARMRRFPPQCTSCEVGTACESCERLMVEAMRRLAAIQSEDAAIQAAALVLDKKLEWDGGPALLLAHAVAGMGERVVPYLEPHKNESPLAEIILQCIAQKHPCI